MKNTFEGFVFKGVSRRAFLISSAPLRSASRSAASLR